MNNHTVRAKGDGWELRSWGNGVSLEVVHDDGRSVFVQGDDALEMWDQWEALERMGPETATGALLRTLWDMHS